MKLLVIRHAIAMEREDFQNAPGASKASDDLRPLTLEGIRRMQKNARGLDCLVKRPTAFFSSPLTRAQQTAEILQTEIWNGLEIQTADSLKPKAKPLALVNAILKVAAERQTEDEALFAIVGHEPHLTKTITWFLKGASSRSLVELKKGGAALLDFEGPVAKAQGTLKWLVTPSILKSLRS